MPVWAVLANAVTTGDATMIQVAAGASITTVILQVVNTVAGVIQKRDELRYNNRVGRLEDKVGGLTEKCEELKVKTEDCHKERDGLKVQIRELMQGMRTMIHDSRDIAHGVVAAASVAVEQMKTDSGVLRKGGHS